MTVEQLIAGALQSADEYAPSPDLFARVKRSIEEDVAHRRRLRRIGSWLGVGATAIAVWIAVFLDVQGGRVTTSWWALEILAAAIQVAIVVLLGPLIRRFGEGLTLEIFRSNRATSKRFLALLDIAYYLIFTAYILLFTNFSAQTEWGGRFTAQLELELIRIGGLLLLMGVLHAITIAVLPVMGLIFASNWRRAARRSLGANAPEPDRAAEQADRIATFIVWAIVAAAAVPGALILMPAILGLVLGAD